MKKIMRKALSLVLVMAMMLVPMTTAWADEATNKSPDNAVELTSSYPTVTVGAGQTLYYSYRPTSGLDQGVNVSGEGTNFEAIAVCSQTGTYAVQATDTWGWGSGSADVTCPILRNGTVVFGVHNKTDAEQSYSLYIGDAAGTSIDNPVPLEGTGKVVFNAYGGQNLSVIGSFYAEKAGTVTITMDDENQVGWKYVIQTGCYDENWNIALDPIGKTHDSNETGDACVPTQTITVSEGDFVYIWVNSCDANGFSQPGKVAFDFTYEASEKDPYAFGQGSLYVGSNEVALSGLADVTLMTFSGGANMMSSELGKYKITVPTGCTLSVWGTSLDEEENTVYNKLATVTGTTYEFDYEEQWSYVYFGFEGAAGTVVIERIGDLDTDLDDDDENGFTNYQNTVSPVPYEFTGNVDNLFYVWLEDEANPTAVLGSDGYYHLGSATGPVLYIDLDMDLHPYYTIAGLQKIAGEGRLYHYTNNIDYSSALLTYAAFKDAKTGLYPVTEDIKTFLVEYGDGQWWYNPESPAYLFGDAEVAEESAWLFMCCYEGVVDKAATDTKWVTDSKDGFVFKVNAEISDFLELKINDKVVEEKYYTLTEGSTIITVSADYMKTLATGDYTVAAVFANAEGEEVSFTTALTVVAPAGNPDTGDHSNIALWIAVLGLGVVAIAGSVVMRKREF